VQHSILDTYANDFAKYASGAALQRLERIFQYVPSAAGQKFKYVNVSPHWQSREIRSAVNLLEKAGVIACVHSTSGKGIPLQAWANEKVFKTYFLDIGLMNSSNAVTYAADSM